MWAFFFQKALIFLYGRQRAPHKTLLIAIFLSLGKKIESLKKCVDNYYSNFFQTAETLQIKGLAEKFESVGNLLTNSTGSSSRKPLISSSSLGSSRLLSVPSQHSVGSRQMSTESLPEYFNRFVIYCDGPNQSCVTIQCIGQINLIIF